MDQRTGQRYLTRPKVLRYGTVELLKVGVDYYSRTKKVYANRQGIPEQLIVWMGFYLKIFDSHTPDNCWYLKDGRIYREPQVCLLENDDECAYYLSGVLPDRSIIVMDGEERYYHVERGKEKRFLITNQNGDFEEVVARLRH